MKVENNCKVLEMTRLSSGAWSMTLETEGLTGQIAMPGQFVHIKCGHSRLLRRPISICNWAEQRELLRLVFEVRGEGTEWLARREVGDTAGRPRPAGPWLSDGAGREIPAGGRRHRRAPHAGLRRPQRRARARRCWASGRPKM